MVLKNVVEIKNLNFGYHNPLFENFNLNIISSFCTIIGSNGSGKSTLAKMLNGLITYDGQIKINRKNIILVSEFFSSNDLDTINQNMRYSLKKLGYKKEEINNKIIEISKALKIENILDYSIHHLSNSEQQLANLACQLVKEPELLILDNATSMLNEVEKEIAFKYLKKLNRNNNMVIINITNDIEETIYGSQVILLHQGKVILDKPTKKALLEEKIFKSCNLDLPFMASLSLKLKYYGLVDELILDMNKMVNKVWK